MNNSFTPPNFSEIKNRIKNENGSSYWGGYLKQGTYGSTPTQKKSFSGRILPMFDYNLSQADANFPQSWAPYRDADRVDQETGQPELTAFFGVASCYSWFGNKQVSFLSPTTYRYTHGMSRGQEMTDPLLDIRNYAKKHEDPAVRALTERPANTKDAKVVLPYAQLRYFFNFYGTAGSDRNIRNYVIDVSKKAFDDLSGKLSEWRPAHETVVDSAWPNYLFGDITNPMTGLLVDTVSIPSNPQPFNGFIFCPGAHKSLKGTRAQPVPQEALIKRSHFYGDNMAFKIMPAQEIVDFLVEDGAVPYYLIQEVCSNYANVPPAPKRAFVSPGSDSEGEDDVPYVPPMPMRNIGYSAPAPAPSTPPPPAACEVHYWLSVGGASPTKHTHTEVTYIMNGGPKGQVRICKVGESDWKTPEQFGFSVSQDIAPPPPADNGSAPPPWGPVAASAPPVVHTNVAPKDSANSLSPEEKAELEQLESEFSSKGGSVHPDILSKVVFLRSKAGYTSLLP
jgi:hypothetical protein